MNTRVTLKERRVKHVQQYQRWSAVHKPPDALAWVSDTDNHRYHSGFTAIIYIWILAMCQKTTWKQWDKVKGVLLIVIVSLAIVKLSGPLLYCFFLFILTSERYLNAVHCPLSTNQLTGKGSKKMTNTMERSGATVKSQVLPSGVGRDRKQRWGPMGVGLGGLVDRNKWAKKISYCKCMGNLGFLNCLTTQLAVWTLNNVWIPPDCEWVSTIWFFNDFTWQQDANPRLVQHIINSWRCRVATLWSAHY